MPMYSHSSLSFSRPLHVVRLLPVFLFLLAFHSSGRVVSAAFTESDLRGPFIRRYGITSCPDNMYFDATSFNFSVASIFVNERACTSGDFTVGLSPTKVPSGGDLAPYLSSTRDVGQVVGIDVTSSLVCANFRFDERTYLTLVRPDANVTVNWSDVFSRNDTILQTATASPLFTFVANMSYVVVNSICLYSSMTETEFNAQRPETCFPRTARVSVLDEKTHGTPKQVPITSLRIGDVVHVGGTETWTSSNKALISKSKTKMTVTSRMIAWTHKDAYRVAPFRRITTQNGATLVVSHGHYVYANNQLMPARKVSVGMIMRMAFQPDSQVSSVDTVWRVGLFNPQTAQGDIVVNGFVCSTYTETVPPMMAHALLAPVRFAVLVVLLVYRLVLGS